MPPPQDLEQVTGAHSHPCFCEMRVILCHLFPPVPFAWLLAAVGLFPSELLAEEHRQKHQGEGIITEIPCPPNVMVGNALLSTEMNKKY